MRSRLKAEDRGVGKKRKKERRKLSLEDHNKLFVTVRLQVVIVAQKTPFFIQIKLLDVFVYWTWDKICRFIRILCCLWKVFVAYYTVKGSIIHSYFFHRLHYAFLLQEVRCHAKFLGMHYKKRIKSGVQWLIPIPVTLPYFQANEWYPWAEGKKKLSLHSRMWPFCFQVSPLVSIKIRCLQDGPPQKWTGSPSTWSTIALLMS